MGSDARIGKYHRSERSRFPLWRLGVGEPIPRSLFVALRNVDKECSPAPRLGA